MTIMDLRVAQRRSRVRTALQGRLAHPEGVGSEVLARCADILNWLEENPNFFPAKWMTRFASRHGYFTCHCGQEASRVASLRGFCKAHEHEAAASAARGQAMHEYQNAVYKLRRRLSKRTKEGKRHEGRDRAKD